MNRVLQVCTRFAFETYIETTCNRQMHLCSIDEVAVVSKLLTFLRRRTSTAVHARRGSAKPMNAAVRLLRRHRMPNESCMWTTFTGADSGYLQAPLAAVWLQSRGSKSSKRRQEVIMLEDVPQMGLLKHQIARVAPGTARNHLVPSGAAVYAHYLNRERYAKQIEAAAEKNADETEDVMAMKAQVRKLRLLKRLGALKVAADVKSDNNVFLESFGVPDITKRILQMTNIVVPDELFMLSQPYTQPGTYMLPLALLNEDGSQVSIAVELTPRQATTAELAALQAS